MVISRLEPTPFDHGPGGLPLVPRLFQVNPLHHPRISVSPPEPALGRHLVAAQGEPRHVHRYTNITRWSVWTTWWAHIYYALEQIGAEE